MWTLIKLFFCIVALAALLIWALRNVMPKGGDYDAD